VVAQGVILSNRYLLQNELGAGGMSVVYKATDLRTGADVAVKIPHAFLLRDKQYVERLKREASIAATLQSPRIAHVTDVGEHEGTPYFVMEYVTGESLADLLTRQGALAPLEALRIVLDVARAMEIANERGVVHRDLKPQNIRISRHSDVKVMDFGIARVEGKPGLTSASLFLGTPDYCAPERAEGPGDIRSDIYSIGVVLYEMVSGRLPFKGATPWTIIQMHATEPPPPLRPGLPPAVYEIVEKCMAKRPEDRYQTPRELADAIQAAIQTLQRQEDAAIPPGAADATQMLRTPPPRTGPVVPVTANEPAPAAVEPATAPAALAAVPTIEERPSSTGPLPAAEPAPKKRRGLLIPVLLGVVVLAALVAVGAFVYMNRGDEEQPPARGLDVIPGAPTLAIVEPAESARVTGPVTVQLDVQGVNLKAPAEADPTGRHIHYFLDVDPATVLAPGLPIPTGQANIIHTAAAAHTFLDLPPGEHKVWAVLTGNDHVPLKDVAPGKVAFTSVPDPLVNARSGDAAPVVYQGLVDGKWRIFVMDGKGGSNRRLTGGNSNDFNPAFSPDGSRIAFQSDRDGSHHIYTMNLDGSDIKRLTTGMSNNRIPAWSSDGNEIVFQSDRDGREHLWTVSVNGGEPQQVTRGPQNDSAPSWSLDGTRIAYHSDAGGGTTHIFVVDRRGGTPKQLTDGPNRDNTPVWSPDGKRLAFASFRDNQWNIYVMNADGSDIRRLTSTSFNVKPSWAPDGKHLLFQSDREGGQQQIFIIPVEGGQARRLTQGPAHNASPSWPLK
jgi:predicted Ser/Thr protein kinase